MRIRTAGGDVALVSNIHFIRPKELPDGLWELGIWPEVGCGLHMAGLDDDETSLWCSWAEITVDESELRRVLRCAPHLFSCGVEIERRLGGVPCV